MENKKNIVLEAMITALISVIISSLIFSITEIFTSEKIGVFISDSNQFDDKYITMINIKNYQDSKKIDKLEINIKNDVIKIDSELEIKKEGNKIIIEDIYPAYNGSIVVVTNEKIDNSKLNIYCSSKANIKWINESKSIIDNIKYNIMIYFIMMFIMTFCSNLYMQNMYKKSEKIKDERIKFIDEEMETNKEKLKEIEIQVIENEKGRRRVRRYLISTIKDYSKELSFWKDTIRKAFCKDKEEMKTMDNFFEFVTINLKTYKTLEKCDYSNIEFILSEKDEKQKRKK